MNIKLSLICILSQFGRYIYTNESSCNIVCPKNVQYLQEKEHDSHPPVRVSKYLLS